MRAALNLAKGCSRGRSRTAMVSEGQDKRACSSPEDTAWCIAFIAFTIRLKWRLIDH
jgi:hypothetical protein